MLSKSTQDAEPKYTLIFFATPTNKHELFQAKTQGTAALQAPTPSDEYAI